MDMKGKQLTVIGTVDPVIVVSKLRKFWATDIIIVGPAKEPEKKEEPKKEEAKKEEEPKKEEAKKEEPKKEAEPKKEEPKKDEEKKKEPEQVVGIQMPYNYRPYYPPMNTYYYAHQSIEENPNACTIS
ncbi:heavy metal transport/detoxification superfamily protein [Actinidia rufa]|uniref:Heavy metal transport/detoxification superfamily protein n=1 Tax=Actinidia rufa TaxID=165716 RepID=A0A7J0DQ21_9ERIC|nr:heavy metal transport/detoxification superfamily protein [Actinidia rufa]